MNLLALLPSLLFALAGLVVIIFMLKMILGGLFSNLNPSFNISNILKEQKFKKKDKLINESVGLLNAGYSKEALINLDKALFLRVSKEQGELKKIFVHNQKIIKLMYSLSEVGAIPINNLSIIEELIRNRFNLNKNLLEVNLTNKSIKKNKHAKESSLWALKEFSNKKADIEEDLVTNHNSLVLELEKLLAEPDTNNDKIIYH